MTTTTTTTKPSVPVPANQKKKENRDEAAAWLEEFRRRLEDGCDALDQAEQWAARLGELAQFLQLNAALLPADTRARLDPAQHQAKAVQAGLDEACKFLQSKVTQAILDVKPADIIPDDSGLYQLLVKLATPLGFGVTAVVVVGMVVAGVLGYWRAGQVLIHVYNVGCGPIPFAGRPAPLGWVSVELPSQPVVAGGDDWLKLPPVPVWLDATRPGMLTLGVFGYQRPIPVAANLTSVTFDGTVLRQARNIPLSAGSSHTLEFACR